MKLAKVATVPNGLPGVSQPVARPAATGIAGLGPAEILCTQAGRQRAAEMILGPEWLHINTFGQARSSAVVTRT